MFSSLRRASLMSPSSPTSGKDPDSPNAQGTGSMFSSLRRASMSISASFHRRGSSAEMLPPLEKRRSTRSMRSKGSLKRASMKKVETVLMEPHYDHTSLVLQQTVYRRADPFKNLSSTWLAGGEKGELPEESSDEELLEQSRHKRKKGKAEVSETEIADFITGLRRNMKKPETQATACEELSQRLGGRKQENIESIVIEEAATAALEAAQEHPDDLQLQLAVCLLLADLMTFSKASGGYPAPVAAAGADLTLQGYLRFYDKLEAEDQLLKVEQAFKRIAKELPVEDQLEIMNSVGDALPSFCAKMYKKAAKKKFQKEEVVRRRQLKNTAFGHLAWLRGHNLRSDLMPTWQVQKLAVEERRKTFVDKGPPTVGGDVWYKCWVPNSQKEWCYKGSFVNEVKFLAESQKMDFCWLTMDGARKIFKREPAFEEMLVNHVAVATDDQRYLWSYAFVQFLTVLMENNYPYGQAHLSPEDFQAKYPKAKFPVPGHYPTKPKSQVMTMPVPVVVSRNLRPTPTLFRHSSLAAGDRDPPAPPPLPDRLPCPIFYEISEPWMCIFASDLEKRDLRGLLDMHRRELALVQAAAAKREREEEGDSEVEQPEEEELEQDDEVDPADVQPQGRSREVHEDPQVEDAQPREHEDEEQERVEDGENGEMEDAEELEDQEDDFGELEGTKEQGDDSPDRPREEGSKNESELDGGDDGTQAAQMRQVRIGRTKSSFSSFGEDSTPKRASRRQSKE